MVRLSREQFWDVMEGFAPFWFALAIADALFGSLAILVLVITPLDTTSSSFVLSILDLTTVVVTLIPLTYVLYRIRQRRIEEY